jgi:hypothetical protein
MRVSPVSAAQKVRGRPLLADYSQKASNNVDSGCDGLFNGRRWGRLCVVMGRILAGLARDVLISTSAPDIGR